MLHKMAGSYAPWWKAYLKQRGFMLMEYVVSLAIGGALAALVCTGLGRTTLSWQRLVSQLELAQAGSYMQGVLEKQLCYNATAVRIRADGNLELDTIEGNKKLVVYYRSKGLYLQTTTGAGTGTNPLYLTGIDVSAWRAEKISGRQLRIDFVLQGQGVERRFVQLVTCCNGEITDETL
ncbi:MAG: hypothetical protein SOV56_07950 [Phascolarctobacterium sp.]|nr:hypothetical protein [Phascolarctobacterium sp.]